MSELAEQFYLAFKNGKSENAPAHLNQAINRGLRLFELKEAGAVFTYPDGLHGEDWDCLLAAQRGFNKHQNEQQKKQQEELERKAKR